MSTVCFNKFTVWLFRLHSASSFMCSSVYKYNIYLWDIYISHWSDEYIFLNLPVVYFSKLLFIWLVKNYYLKSFDCWYLSILKFPSTHADLNVLNTLQKVGKRHLAHRFHCCLEHVMTATGEGLTEEPSTTYCHVAKHSRYGSGEEIVKAMYQHVIT